MRCFGVVGEVVEKVEHAPFLVQDALGLKAREKVMQTRALALVIVGARDCHMLAKDT